jgi:hypothetical protein
MTIRMTMKGLAKYMTAQPAAQRKILRDYKYPEPEGLAQARYYGDAVRVIGRLIAKRIGLDDARDFASSWRESALVLPPARRTKATNNARAVEQYLEHFAQHSFELLPNPSLRLTRGGVIISATPDLRVRHGKRELLLKLEFAKQQPDERSFRVMSQIMFEASVDLASSTIVIADVPRGRLIRGARMGSRLKADILAACRAIEAIWPTISPPTAVVDSRPSVGTSEEAQR